MVSAKSSNRQQMKNWAQSLGTLQLPAIWCAPLGNEWNDGHKVKVQRYNEILGMKSG